MKRSTLATLVQMALGVSFIAEPTNGGTTEEAKKTSLVSLPKNVASWHEQGKKEGKRVKDAIDKGEMLAEEVLLVYAEHLAEHDEDGNLVPAANDFLNGYISNWSNPDVQKARKTEAKAVFDAFAMGDQIRELTVGFDKDTKAPTKESHTIAEWLKQHEGVKGYEGYRGLIGLAREMRGAAKGRGAGGGANRGPRTVTDKQQGEIEARIEVMNANQAHAVAQRGLAQLAKLPQFEIVQFRMITAACDMVLNKSTDEACKRKAQAIRDLAEDMVERLKVAQATATPAITSAAPAPAAAPAKTPAAAPQPAVGEQQPAQPEQKTGTSG